MIISASRRTDIPALYADWLINRIHAGFACVRNPMNPRQISRVKLTPDVVDGFVFWSKNPAPMRNRLDALRDYAYYFQYTLTPYGRELEPHVPDTQDALRTFQALADAIGPQRVIWRYDPIVVNPMYPAAFHLRRFEAMAKRLEGYTNKVIISFLELDYRNARRNAQVLQAEPLPADRRRSIAAPLAAIARGCGMEMNACAEPLDLRECGVTPAHCVDARLMETLLGTRLEIPKDANQRPACGCDASVDIGMYNTCGHGCRYCYANYNAGEIANNRQKHDPMSPLLVGSIGPTDTVTERVIQSNRADQLKFDF
ncbi:MAG TPA: DUF1848 domain-containing protein [Candidatus Limiplasma sp.]|nr:DUF1848 domain-containing protein [Candidatus Limiplasma sp.]